MDTRRRSAQARQSHAHGRPKAQRASAPVTCTWTPEGAARKRASRMNGINLWNCVDDHNSQMFKITFNNKCQRNQTLTICRGVSERISVMSMHLQPIDIFSSHACHPLGHQLASGVLQGL
eukprot:gene20289-biopygen17570